MNLSKEQRIAKHKDFLNANWRLLAAFAWENYLSKGRGMVVVPEEDFVHADRPQFAALRIRYAPADGDDFKTLPDWEGSKEQGWLETYDPAQKVIVMILREGGGTSGYLIGAHPIPPDSFRASKSSAN